MKNYDIKFRCYKKLYIDDSIIAGKGVFTSEDIKAGEIIMNFGGILASLTDRFSGKYLPSTFAGISENTLICEDISSKKDFSDYLNHSCSPNIGMDDCITIIAITDISKNSELVYDYAFCEADENWKLKSECTCGSSNCRKKITGKDWRLFNKSNKLFPYFSPFIQRRIIANEKI